MPGGLNFSFDPRTMSISKAWTGGFLNLKNEMSGRGNNPSSLGHKSSEITFAGQPASHHSHPVDLSFKSPHIGDGKTIEKNLWGDSDFADQLKRVTPNSLDTTTPATLKELPPFTIALEEIFTP